MKKYYEAYDQRYKTAHARGVSWLSDQRSPIVLDIIQKYGVSPSDSILEIGCGEGRDAWALLERGYELLATDISAEAIQYCKGRFPSYQNHFAVLDCLYGKHSKQYAFIYSVAVIHMLVLDQDRKLFYRFLSDHLTKDGLALICSMGDGLTQRQSDIRQAFALQQREHPSGRMIVAGTSCRMVTFETFEKEIRANGLRLVEKGLTAALPDFNSLMFAVVQKMS